MKITVIGTGYVGLVQGTCLAEVGHSVMCIDVDEKKIANLKKGIIPIYEPGLEELVLRNYKEGRLQFSTKIEEGIQHGKVIFSAVGTPPDQDHRADLQYVKQVAQSFGEYLNEYKVFVNKSTVPVGTGDVCKKIIQAELNKRKQKIEFDIVSNPEFLREGCAIRDFMVPDRIICGLESQKAHNAMEEVYKPFTKEGKPTTGTSILFTDIKSSELIKYAANSFLAVKISFINEIANFCELVGANVEKVAMGIGMDKRIGNRFLHAGIGYGGSCFPKDVNALMISGKDTGHHFHILEAAEKVNNQQKVKVISRLKEELGELKNKTIALWGLSFKPKTDDLRDAPSLKIIYELQKAGAKIKAFDPVAYKNVDTFIKDKTNLKIMSTSFECLKNADALLILTEWDAFRGVDLGELKSQLKGNLIIDGRNIYNPQEMKTKGIKYYSIGRP